MGIRHLQTFQQRQVRNGYYQIDIIQEIQAFKSCHPQPIIVIDVMSFLSVHNRNSLEGIFGGRYQIYEAMYHSLFQRLKAAGAELVFFIDGPVQDAKDHVWLSRQTEKYQNCIDVLDKIAEGELTATEIIGSFRNIPNNNLFDSEFPSICKMYGRTFVSYYNECDLEVAAFACINNALAVIADDTDYLIHRGDWHYWSARQIDVENLTTYEYDRLALRDCLKLSDDHMRVLATIGGNDVLKYELVEPFHRQLTWGSQGKFYKIAQYIRDSLKGPGIVQQDIAMLCEHMFGRVTNELFNLVRQSLRIYDVDLVQFNYEPDNLLRYTMDRGKTQLFAMLADKPVNFTLFFDDLRPPGSRSNFEIALPLIQRQMGIVLQHKDDPQLVRFVCTKRTHNEPFSTFSLAPVYPDILIPPLLEFYRSAEQPNDPYMELRLDLLIWFLGSSRINRTVLIELPLTHLMGILTLNYLREQKAITIDDADLLLLMNNDIVVGKVPENLPYPKYFSESLVKLSFLYLKTMRRVKRGIDAIKLERFPTKFHFDGVYLHTLAGMAKSVVNGRVQEIDCWRIYVD